MCANRKHRYRIEILISLVGGDSRKESLVVEATGVADAVAQADGWAYRYYPEAQFVTFNGVTHSGYRSATTAREHGAIIPPNVCEDGAWMQKCNTPARLDADRSAKPLTELVTHLPRGACIGPGSMGEDLVYRRTT